MASPAPVLSGYLDSFGNPGITIKVYGVAEAAQQEFEATIDTGFSGFLMMPMASAFPLTLTLMSSADYELADGSLVSKLLAHGSVVIGDQTVSGAITLEPNECGLLLGMAFLNKAKRSLWVHQHGVDLVDRGLDEWVKRVLTA